MPPDAFPEIAPLIAAAKADGIDARSVLARVITDLFVSRGFHSEAELAQFTALIEPLIRAIDTDALVPVARKLAAHEPTPRSVVEALLARDDEASYEVLRSSASLDLRTLDILAERGSRLVALAIASRDVLAESTARILTARHDAALDRTLARPRDPPLPRDLMSLLVSRAQDDGELSMRLLAIPDLPFGERCSLFLQADPQQRAAIVDEAKRRAFLTRARPSPFMRDDIDQAVMGLNGAGAARLAEMLTGFLRLAPEEALAVVKDSTGEALVLALRACGARPAPIIGLLLSRGLHLSRSVERIFALDHLARETSGAAAAMIVSAFTDASALPVRQVSAAAGRREAERQERQPLPVRGELPQSAFKRRELKR